MKALATLVMFGLACAGQEQPATPIPPVYTSITVTATPSDGDATVETKPSEVFSKTLFSRDDQIFHVLDSGINAGQHEGGGKSLEIRRFGFNLDHGGVNGGLKVLVNDVPQNQTTQGHGQGYLGSLKSISPELVQEVSIIDGPFSAEYGDFSGLGVVHIRLRDSLPDKLTLRAQGGSFNTGRGFAAWSPDLQNGDAFIAYEISRTDGPFLSPLRYSRDNLTGNLTRRLTDTSRLGWRWNLASNDFYSSGQIPLDEVAAGRLDPFGYIDPTDGGRVKSGTASMYYELDHPKDTLRLDGFVARSLFDLYSNFTFYLKNPVNGDGIQQHDSRLQGGANGQYTRFHSSGWFQCTFSAGGNFHDNAILVGLYSRVDRNPIDTTTLAHAHVTNAAAYAQESLSFFHGRLITTAGIRFDEFRFAVRDLVSPTGSGTERAGVWQPKAGLAWTPSYRVPVRLSFNYGRGISTADARAVVQRPDQPRVSKTDFFQAKAAYRFRRVSASVDGFLIDRSNEQVYVPDDGSFEFKGPSRAYGLESKLDVAITRHIALTGGVTEVGNAVYRGTAPRLYVDSAPHFVANAGLTVTSWKGWSGSLRMRAINHYRLDDEDRAIVAGGHTVFDLGISRQLRRGLEFNVALDNIANRLYYETQNYFESRLPDQDPMFRIHATPGYSRTIMAGLTYRLGSK